MRRHSTHDTNTQALGQFVSSLAVSCVVTWGFIVWIVGGTDPSLPVPRVVISCMAAGGVCTLLARLFGNPLATQCGVFLGGMLGYLIQHYAWV